MATANSHISGALTKAASKKKPRKAKSDVIKKDSSGTATHVLRKHPPPKLSKKKNDIYINRRTEFPVQLVRCTKLLEEGYVPTTHFIAIYVIYNV